MTKKVKRAISLIIAAIMLLSTMSVLAFAASEEVVPHEHVATVDKYGAVVKTEDTSVYAQPTCVKEGCKEYFVKCAICGKEIPGTREKVSLPVLASHHQEGPVSIEKVVEPTCATDGSYYEVTRCVLCNAVLSKTLVAVKATNNHVPDLPVKENIVNATCAKEGSYDSVTRCIKCNKILGLVHKVIPVNDYHVSEYSLDRIVTNLGNGKVSIQFLTTDPNGAIVYPLVDGPVAGLKTDANGAIVIVRADGTPIRADRLPELLTETDSGVATGYFAAGQFAANGGKTRTCADGEERCAICGTLLKEEIAHTWDAGEVIIPATLTTPSLVRYRCLIKGCGAVTSKNGKVDTPKKGDVDLSGTVTAGDARYILRYAVGLGDIDGVISPSGRTFTAADVDGNKAIEPADARLALRLAVGLRNA